jgi:hypothetical protein
MRTGFSCYDTCEICKQFIDELIRSDGYQSHEKRLESSFLQGCLVTRWPL